MVRITCVKNTDIETARNFYSLQIASIKFKKGYELIQE